MNLKRPKRKNLDWLNLVGDSMVMSIPSDTVSPLMAVFIVCFTWDTRKKNKKRCEKKKLVEPTTRIHGDPVTRLDATCDDHSNEARQTDTPAN